MKYKKLLVPKYLFKDELGEFEFRDIVVLVDADSGLDSSNFDPENDDYSISSKETEKMNKESAVRFFNEKYTSILKETESLDGRQINGIRLFLDVNGSGLAKLLKLNRSGISNYISGNTSIQAGTAVLLMEKMKDEIEIPGISKTILEKMNKDDTDAPGPIQSLGLSATVIAEWLIRKFIGLDENLTNLKLQKLLYYSQGVAFGKYDSKLMNDELHAWENGPVVEAVCKSYMPFKASPLPIDASANLDALDSNSLALDILKDTVIVYGKYSAWALREKTHCEPPWRETERDASITDDKMIKFFNKVWI